MIAQALQTFRPFIHVLSSVGEQDIAKEILIRANISRAKDKANLEVEVREDGLCKQGKAKETETTEIAGG